MTNAANDAAAHQTSDKPQPEFTAPPYLRINEGTNQLMHIATRLLIRVDVQMRYRDAVHESIPDFAMPPESEVRRAADMLRMLSDPTRIKILWALLQGENSVTCLADVIGATPTAVSQHLSKLRLAGLVEHRRAGTFIYYTVADDTIRHVLEQVLATRSASSAARG